LENIRLSWLISILLAAGLGCIGFCLIPEAVFVRLLTADTGERAASLVNWLHSVFPVLGAGFLLLGFIFWTVSSKPVATSAFSQLLSTKPEPSVHFPLREVTLWFVYCALLVFIPNFAALQQGGFHADDFELLSVARAVPLSESIWIPHGIHTLPLMRVETTVLRALFGFDAFYYNLLNLLMISVTFASIALVLRELGIKTLAIILTVTLCAGHADWTLLTTGYYLQNVYLQATMFSTLAVFFYFRWKFSDRNGWFLLMVISTFLGCFTDLAGLWVPLAVLAFLVPHELGQNIRLREQWPTILAISAVFIAGVVYNAIVFTRCGSFIPPAGDPVTKTERLLSLWYFFSGSLGLSWVCPLYYHILHLKHLLIPALIVSSIVWLMILGWFFKRADRQKRWTAIGIFLVLLGFGAMVILGRDFAFLHYQGHLYTWPTKYTSNSNIWCAILLGIIFHQLLSCKNRLWQLRATQLLIAVTLLLLPLHWIFAEAGIHVNYDYGRPSLLKMRDGERQTLQKLSKLFTWIEQTDLSKPVYLPTIPNYAMQGGALYENGVLPDAFLSGYDLSFYRDFLFPAGSNVILLKTPEMYGSHAFDVQTVDRLASYVSPVFLQQLQQNPKLKALYTKWDAIPPYYGESDATQPEIPQPE